MAQVPIDRLIAQWPDPAIALLKRWASPQDVYDFLLEIEVDDAPVIRSPLTVLRDRLASPLDGALFACAALRAQGHPPRLLVLFSPTQGLCAAALWREGGHVCAMTHEPSRRRWRAGCADEQQAGDVLEAELTDGSAIARTIIDLQTMDAQDWMGDDGQLAGLLAAIEAGLDEAAV